MHRAVHHRHNYYCLTLLLILLSQASGCSRIIGWMNEGQGQGDKNVGITYYVGGAGPIGHIGSLDVPNGLRDAGYEGYVEIYNWQSWTHAGDQINIERNREKAAEFAYDIRRYRRRYPRGRINIIALSAGTGITTFALEYLSEDVGVDNVVFLACSLSSRYDMTRALKRVRGRLYVIYSPTDRVLRDVVWYTGTVDRTDASEGIAGLEGFIKPSRGFPDTERQYRKMRSVLYRPEFAAYDYRGGHIDATSREFVRYYLAPAIMGNDSGLSGRSRRYRQSPNFPMIPPPTSQPRAGDQQIVNREDKQASSPRKPAASHAPLPGTKSNRRKPASVQNAPKELSTNKK